LSPLSLLTTNVTTKVDWHDLIPHHSSLWERFGESKDDKFNFMKLVMKEVSVSVMWCWCCCLFACFFAFLLKILREIVAIASMNIIISILISSYVLFICSISVRPLIYLSYRMFITSQTISYQVTDYLTQYHDSGLSANFGKNFGPMRNYSSCNLVRY